MSAPKMSRNRDDYSKSIQLLIEAGAEVLFNGNIDRAWEAFFKQRENAAQFEEPRHTNDSAILHLRITPQSDNPRSR